MIEFQRLSVGFQKINIFKALIKHRHNQKFLWMLVISFSAQISDLVLFALCFFCLLKKLYFCVNCFLEEVLGLRRDLFMIWACSKLSWHVLADTVEEWNLRMNVSFVFLELVGFSNLVLPIFAFMFWVWCRKWLLLTKSALSILPAMLWCNNSLYLCLHYKLLELKTNEHGQIWNKLHHKRTSKFGHDQIFVASSTNFFYFNVI